MLDADLAKILTLNNETGRGHNIKYNPHAFTESGLYMLMTVLKGELATAQSKALIRIFKGMKDYISKNRALIGIDDYIGIKSIMHLRNEFPDILIDFKRTNNTMHDRYIILDYGKRSEKVYHCGASSKDAGKKATTIMEVQDRAVYKQLIDALITNPALRIA